MDEITTRLTDFMKAVRDELEKIQICTDRLTRTSLEVVSLAVSILEDARKGSDETALAERHIDNMLESLG